MKPVIGINANVAHDEESISVGASYIDAITSAGGIPIILPALKDVSLVDSFVKRCDGFVFIGGADIDPSRYDQEPHSSHNPLAERREIYDFALIERVLKEKKPFLAVCLGHQEVNVARGGTLIQDIQSETSAPLPHSSRQEGYTNNHPVTVEKNTILYDIVGSGTLITNSSHHQSISEPGKGVLVSARASDGIIEAFELKNYPFGMGLQWHPERMISQKEHLRIFTALVQAAAGKLPQRKALRTRPKAGG